jgi:phenylacetate-CoA ligase
MITEKMEYLYVLKHLAELKLHQKRSREELLNIQLDRLQKLVVYAYNNVPFYRELFINNNIDPKSIRKIEDIQKIPIITKKDIIGNYDKILADGTDISKCEIISTTGSTGIPLKVYYDKKSLYYSTAIVYFGFFESGLKLTDRIVELTGTMGDCSNALIKKSLISVYEKPEKIMKMLKEYDPTVLYSFPSILKILSNSLDKELSSLNTRLIFTHGETLTESCRKIICSKFGANVSNTYGSTEFNRLAFECNEHGLHMITDGAIIETIKDGQSVGPGEEGEIVVTGLYNYTMPLIRYKLGDIGILDDRRCPCGRGWPLIKNIEGRTDDFLTLPSGAIISPRTINTIEDIQGVIEYKTIQLKRDTFLVQVVPSKEFTDISKIRIGEMIKLGCLGEDIKVDVELVNKLPRERTGKLRAIVSNV